MELKGIYERYRKNKDCLKFSASVVKTEDNKYRIVFGNLDKRYKKALSELVADLIREAQNYIISEFRIDVLEEDKDMECLRFKKTLNEELCMLLNNLLNSSLESFIRNTAYLSTKYKQLYEISNVKLVNGKLVDRKGRQIA